LDGATAALKLKRVPEFWPLPFRKFWPVEEAITSLREVAGPTPWGTTVAPRLSDGRPTLTAMADVPPYEIEFYEDEDGTEPALAFMRSLSPLKKRAMGVAINEVLQYEGPAVAEGNMGDNLGGGLYEFRLDQNAEQILRRKGKVPKPEPEKGKILLRLFFHPHGNKLLLLLCGYDKGERSSRSHQQEEIQAARTLLARWKERARSKRPAGRRGGRAEP
jgi:putative component of toxin-antitoxin plasmid stabilization module